MLVDSTLFADVANAFLAQSGWEWIAASLGIGYVILAAKESIWCWPAAFASTLIYTLLFWQGQLPMQALLNVYYMGMAVYGWRLWRTDREDNEVLVISTRPGRFHIGFVVSGVILSLITAYYLEQVIGSRLPYLDAFVTVFSVMNTVLMARKVLESWIYWIVINAAAIALYFQTGYYVTIVMFMVYLVLAIYGYKNWRALQIQAHTV